MVNPRIEFGKHEDSNYIEDEYENRKIKYVQKLYELACGECAIIMTQA